MNTPSHYLSRATLRRFAQKATHPFPPTKGAPKGKASHGKGALPGFGQPGGACCCCMSCNSKANGWPCGTGGPAVLNLADRDQWIGWNNRLRARPAGVGRPEPDFLVLASAQDAQPTQPLPLHGTQGTAGA
jgi:hypothetical protein